MAKLRPTHIPAGYGTGGAFGFQFKDKCKISTFGSRTKSRIIAFFSFSEKRFIGKDFFRLFRIDPMTKLEVEGVSLVLFKVIYFQMFAP